MTNRSGKACVAVLALIGGLAAAAVLAASAELVGGVSADSVASGTTVPSGTSVRSGTPVRPGTPVRLGTSVRGRPLVAFHRPSSTASASSTSDSITSVRLLVIGNMHGDEKAGLRVVEELRRRPLPSHIDLWLIPTINPDGTSAGTRTNARHVDLNRNFPHLWVRADAGTQKYSGPTASSEPETRALMRFVRSHQPQITVVFHQPLFGVDSYRAKSMALVRDLAREAQLPVRSFSCGGTCRGTFTGWHNRNLPGAAVTVEFGRTVSDAEVRRVAAAVLAVAAAR